MRKTTSIILFLLFITTGVLFELRVIEESPIIILFTFLGFLMGVGLLAIDQESKSKEE